VFQVREELSVAAALRFDEDLEKHARHRISLKLAEDTARAQVWIRGQSEVCGAWSALLAAAIMREARKMRSGS
jgi:hypothetical protein